MASIAVLCVPGTLAGDVAEALRGLGGLIFFTRAADLVAEPDVCDFSAVVLTTTHDADRTSVLESIVGLRQRCPLLWIALYHGPPGRYEGALRAIASVLLRVVWIGGGPSTLQAVLAGAIATPPVRRAPAEIQLLFATYAPRPVRQILDVCLANTHRRLLPQDVEAKLSTAGRTLRGRLARAGWPGLRLLIAWCRILHAVFLLDLLGLPQKQVADQLGFGSAAALNSTIKRTVGMTTGEVLERGGYPHLLDRFDQLLRRGGAVRRWTPEGLTLTAHHAE
jgi:hypothetical protein